MLTSGIISASDSPYCSPVLLVRKPDNTYRFAVDYRKINAMAYKSSYPLANIIETLEAVAGSQYYSIIDAKSAYHQIEMEEASKQYTAFHTPSGAYHFNRMSFGLQGAPATWNRCINQILRKQIGRIAYIYLDDACIYAENFDQHLKNVEEILSEFKEAGVKIGLPKCSFAKSSVKFLGHIVSAAGVRPDPGNIQAMANFPRPTTVRRVRGFLGACGYYRRFIANFAGIAAPLTELTRKNTRFHWSEEQQAAFDTLKTMMTNTPVLKPPDLKKEIHSSL